MSHPVQITVVIKGSDSTYRQKFLCYEPIELVPGNAVIGDCIREAKESYKGDVDEITVRASTQWYEA